VNGQSADWVLGQGEFGQNQSNRGGSSGLDTLGYPWGIACDAQGTLWVGDQSNYRLLGFRLDKSTCAAQFVIGQYYSVNNKSITYPHGICVDALGNIWASDGQTNRVVLFSAFALTSVSPSTGYNHRVENVKLSGRKFPAGSAVTLRSPSQPDAPAQVITVTDTSLTFSVNLLGKATASGP